MQDKWYDKQNKQDRPNDNFLKITSIILGFVLVTFVCGIYINAKTFEVRPGEAVAVYYSLLPPEVIRTPGMYFKPSFEKAIHYKETSFFQKELSCRLKDANLIKIEVSGRYDMPKNDRDFMHVDTLFNHNQNKILDFILLHIQRRVLQLCARAVTEDADSIFARQNSRSRVESLTISTYFGVIEK